MILRTKGKTYNIFDNTVGKVTRNVADLDNNSFLIVEEPTIPNLSKLDFLGVLTSATHGDVHNTISKVESIPSLEHLENGDIVSVSPEGNIHTLFRINSIHNSLLVTERCNSNCLMCSQPPKNKNDIEEIFRVLKKLIPLIPKDCIQLGITGGEPTLMGDLFFNLLEEFKKELPETEIHVLTNGRSFAWNHMAERLGKLNHPRLMLGIPVYSDFYQIHDYVVQAENAFDQTILGLHNLTRYGQRVEIRVVLHQQTIPRIKQLSRYIYKNLPFVEHVAFMGLEYIGYTPFNIDKLWIDPYDYQHDLSEAVEYLSEKGINVSIYNTPLCLLPENVWQFARKSISDWKNDYLPECLTCTKLDQCGGFFTWNLKKHSEYITPFN